MPQADSLREFGQLADALADLVVFAVAGRQQGGLGDLGQNRIANALGLGVEFSGQVSEFAVGAGEGGILDRIDHFGQTDDEAVDVFSQLANVFLCRADGRLAFEHDAGVIGSFRLELEGGVGPWRDWAGGSGLAGNPVLTGTGGLPQLCAMRCHACDFETPLAPGTPVGFREECGACSADLHVCLNCVHHDPGAYNGCRESSAERVADAGRANRCEYFRAQAPGPGAGKTQPADSSREAAMDELERLFSKDVSTSGGTNGEG